MHENKILAPEPTTEDVSEKETQTGFGSMKGNSINPASADALNNPDNEQSELFDILKNYSKQPANNSGDDDPEQRALLLEQLKNLGIEISKIKDSVSVKKLKILLELWTQFYNREKPNGKGKINFDSIKTITDFNYTLKDGDDKWILYVWVQRQGENSFAISTGFHQQSKNSTYNHHQLYRFKNDKLIPVEGNINSKESISDKNISENETPSTTENKSSETENINQNISGEEVLTETKNTNIETETIETDVSQQKKETNTNIEDAGENPDDKSDVNLTVPDQETTKEDIQTSEGNPEDILYEKVPTHKWNSTGYKFSRRDGKPLTSGQVYTFIREQKKLGNQEFIEAFKPHIKGKDPDGTAPNFEIADSKYKYYNYSFDPEWGKKEETIKEPEVTEGDKKYIDRKVNETAFVRVRTAEREKFVGIRLHDFPSPAGKNTQGKGAKIYPGGTALTIIAYANEEAPGWILVQTPDGQTGWIADNWTVRTNTGDDSRYTLRYVEEGETVTDLLREIGGVVRDISYDNKLFANALYLLNKDNPDVYLNNGKYQQSLRDNAAKNVVDPWDAQKRAILQSIEIKQGGQVKIPTKKTIDEMIAKGQIEVRPGWVTVGIKGVRIIEGLLDGIPIGIYEQAKDTVVGLWDMIKSIFTGEILDMLVQLYEVLTNMTWDTFKTLILSLIGVDANEFKDIWDGKNITTYARYKYFGEIIGRIIFEIVALVFVPGAIIGKALSKIPAVAKILNTLRKVDKLVPDEALDDFSKIEKTVDKVDEAIVPPYKKKPDLKETYDQRRADFEKEFETFKKTPDFLNKRKAKFDAYKKKKGSSALDEIDYNKKYDQLYKNREIGKIGEEVFEEFMGGYIKPKKAVQTSGGKRYFDNVKDGVAREIKTGTKTSAETIKDQMMKDAEIIDLNLSSDVTKIEWHFLDSYDPKVVQDILKEVYQKYPSVVGKFDVKFY